jgi:hypothetical protein
LQIYHGKKGNCFASLLLFVSLFVVLSFRKKISSSNKNKWKKKNNQIEELWVVFLCKYNGGILSSSTWGFRRMSRLFLRTKIDVVSGFEWSSRGRVHSAYKHTCI